MTDTAAVLPQFEHLGDANRWLVELQALRPSCALLGGLAPPEVRLLARYLDVYRGAAGSEVVAAGESGEFMMLVIEGRLAARSALQGEASPAAPAELGPGGTLGELAMIDGEPHAQTWEARDATLLAVLQRESLARAILEHPGLGAKLLMALVMTLSAQLREARAAVRSRRSP